MCNEENKQNGDKKHPAQSGGSYYITLPIGIVRKFGWKERQKVTVRPMPGKKVEIKDWKK